MWHHSTSFITHKHTHIHHTLHAVHISYVLSAMAIFTLPLFYSLDHYFILILILIFYEIMEDLIFYCKILKQCTPTYTHLASCQKK